MAKFTLKEGAHYHGVPPFSTLPWVGEKAMARRVTFDKTAAYDSAPYNATDVNKLFGLSFGFGGVHGNSARFGWRWSNGDQCIELLAYVYNQGTRNWDEQLRFPVVAQVQLGQEVECSIMVDHDPEYGIPHYVFEVSTPARRWPQVIVALAKDPKAFGLTHGLYFGGELTAPHTMAVQIDRL